MNRRESAAKWALYAHYARLLGADGGLIDRRQAAGEMTPAIVAEIADEYWVTRSIPGVCPEWGAANYEDSGWKDHHRKIIADGLNATDWSADFSERQVQCCNLARGLAEQMQQSLKQDRAKQVSIASAISKLSWFDALSSNWTLYDKYARRAVLGNVPGDAVEKMAAFYNTLSVQGFCEVAGKIADAIAPMQVQMYSGKVIDHFLMAACPITPETRSDFEADNRSRGGTLRKRLPPSAREILDQCAQSVETILLECKLAAQAG